MTEYERVREEIAKYVTHPYRCEGNCHHWCVDCGGFNDHPCLLQCEIADHILSLDGIEIRADDQNCPISEYVDGIFSGDKKLARVSYEANTIYEKAQIDMKEVGFVRVIPHERT